MAVSQTNTVDARVEVNLRVPRDAVGDLPAGVNAVLANVDQVAAVETVDIAGVRPTAFDIRVDVVARLALAVSDADAGRDRLADGFGVERVDHVAIETD